MSRIRGSVVHHNHLEGLAEGLHGGENAGQALANPKLFIMGWNDEGEHTQPNDHRCRPPVTPELPNALAGHHSVRRPVQCLCAGRETSTKASHSAPRSHPIAEQ